MQCQCGSNQGQCQCGSAMSLFLEKNIASYWIQEPFYEWRKHQKSATMLEACGLKASIFYVEDGGKRWGVHHGECNKIIENRLFFNPDEAVQFGIEWIKSQNTIN